MGLVLEQARAHDPQPRGLDHPDELVGREEVEVVARALRVGRVGEIDAATPKRDGRPRASHGVEHEMASGRAYDRRRRAAMEPAELAQAQRRTRVARGQLCARANRVDDARPEPERAAGPEHPAHLLQHPRGLGDVVERRREQRRVECPRREGESLADTAHERERPARRPGERVDADDTSSAERGDVGRLRVDAAADVEHAPLEPAKLGEGARDAVRVRVPFLRSPLVLFEPELLHALPGQRLRRRARCHEQHRHAVLDRVYGAAGRAPDAALARLAERSAAGGTGEQVQEVAVDNSPSAPGHGRRAAQPRSGGDPLIVSADLQSARVEAR